MLLLLYLMWYANRKDDGWKEKNGQKRSGRVFFLTIITVYFILYIFICCIQFFTGMLFSRFIGAECCSLARRMRGRPDKWRIYIVYVLGVCVCEREYYNRVCCSICLDVWWCMYNIHTIINNIFQCVRVSVYHYHYHRTVLRTPYVLYYYNIYGYRAGRTRAWRRLWRRIAWLGVSTRIQTRIHKVNTSNSG